MSDACGLAYDSERPHAGCGHILLYTKSVIDHRHVTRFWVSSKHEVVIGATALPIFTNRRGVAGIYIILELLDLSCMSMSMDATVLIKSV